MCLDIAIENFVDLITLKKLNFKTIFFNLKHLKINCQLQGDGIVINSEGKTTLLLPFILSFLVKRKKKLMSKCTQ